MIYQILFNLISKKMSPTEVDVIVPNFNKGKFLEECIESVLEQDFDSWKLYIIDDNSTDNSLKILKKYESNSKINIIKLKKNKGPSFCRNLGIRLSKSSYISFLDSDDLWSKKKLSGQIEFMKKNNYDFTYNDYVSFIDSDKKKYINKTNIVSKLNFNKFTKNSSINSSTMIVKRNIIKGIFFKKIAILEDYLFKCQLLSKGFIAFKYPDNMDYYRIIKNSRSSKRLKNIIYLWKINAQFNKFNFFKNLISVLSISINSLKKYGLK